MWWGETLANSLSPKIGGEIFGKFRFSNKDTKLVRKTWQSNHQQYFPPLHNCTVRMCVLAICMCI